MGFGMWKGVWEECGEVPKLGDGGGDARRWEMPMSFVKPGMRAVSILWCQCDEAFFPPYGQPSGGERGSRCGWRWGERCADGISWILILVTSVPLLLPRRLQRCLPVALEGACDAAFCRSLNWIPNSCIRWGTFSWRRVKSRKSFSICSRSSIHC